jgi:phage gpG-like protein
VTRLHVGLVGVGKLDRRLATLARRTQDLRPAWRAVAEDFQQVQQRRFASGGNGDWPPLSEAYARRKPPGAPIMVLTGRLKRSLTAGRTRGAIRRVTKTRVVMGSSNPVAHLHQKGTGGRLPQRRLIAIDRRERKRWAGILLDHIVQESS